MANSGTLKLPHTVMLPTSSSWKWSLSAWCPCQAVLLCHTMVLVPLNRANSCKSPLLVSVRVHWVGESPRSRWPTTASARWRWSGNGARWWRSWAIPLPATPRSPWSQSPAQSLGHPWRRWWRCSQPDEKWAVAEMQVPMAKMHMQTMVNIPTPYVPPIVTIHRYSNFCNGTASRIYIRGKCCQALRPCGTRHQQPQMVNFWNGAGRSFGGSIQVKHSNHYVIWSKQHSMVIGLLQWRSNPGEFLRNAAQALRLCNLKPTTSGEFLQCRARDYPPKLSQSLKLWAV